jgi:hypothetical protein
VERVDRGTGKLSFSQRTMVWKKSLRGRGGPRRDGVDSHLGGLDSVERDYYHMPMRNREPGVTEQDLGGSLQLGGTTEHKLNGRRAPTARGTLDPAWATGLNTLPFLPLQVFILQW